MLFRSGVALFGSLGGISLRQSLGLGIALLPMSGIAFLLTEDIRSLYPEFGAHVGAIVLSMVAILEIVGPIGVLWALTANNEPKKGAR